MDKSYTQDELVEALYASYSGDQAVRLAIVANRAKTDNEQFLLSLLSTTERHRSVLQQCLQRTRQLLEGPDAAAAWLANILRAPAAVQLAVARGLIERVELQPWTKLPETVDLRDPAIEDLYPRDYGWYEVATTERVFRAYFGSSLRGVGNWYYRPEDNEYPFEGIEGITHWRPIRVPANPNHC